MVLQLGHPDRRQLLHNRFTIPGASSRSFGETVPPGAVAVATKQVQWTKQQEFDDYLNYEVTIPRWRFELMRLGAWFLVFQVSFFVFLIIPLVVMRTITGADSPYIP